MPKYLRDMRRLSVEMEEFKFELDKFLQPNCPKAPNAQDVTAVRSVLDHLSHRGAQGIYNGVQSPIWPWRVCLTT